MKNRHKDIYQTIPEGCNREFQSYKKVAETPDKDTRGWSMVNTRGRCITNTRGVTVTTSDRNLPGRVAVEPPESCGRQLLGWLIEGSRGGINKIKYILSCYCSGSRSLSNKPQEPDRLRSAGLRVIQNAFTLIELLVVVLIIGILVAIAVPQYEVAVEKSRIAEAIALVRAIGQAENNYYLANGIYASDINLLGIDYPGKSASYFVPGFQTNDWLCRPTIPMNMTGNWTEALAVCTRGKLSSFYAIGQLKDGRLFCYGYTKRGQRLCQTFGNTSYKFSNNQIAILFN